MSKLLLIDDDIELCELLEQYLTDEGFTINSCHDGESGVSEIIKKQYDVIILDVMLPKMNGFEVLKLIRGKTDTPVLMLTARGDDIDRIIGLEIGADDYLPKPCNPRELVARIRAILRRIHKTPQVKPIINIDGVEIDCNSRIVKLNSVDIELTNAEFNILQMLMSAPDQAFSKEELTEQALERKYTAYDRSIDVHISNLRNKLGENSNGNPRLRTVRGFGYTYDA